MRAHVVKRGGSTAVRVERYALGLFLEELCGLPRYLSITKVCPAVVLRYGFYREFTRKSTLKFIEVSVLHVPRAIALSK